MSSKSKLHRPPFVLAHLADLAGCGFHRIIRPMQIMGRNGIITGRAEANFLSDPVLNAIRPDVVVWQRQNDDFHVETMKRYRAVLPDAFFIYELDDALSAVPDKSWHKPFMAPNVDAKTRIAVAQCDAVTVTTQDLADHMRAICEPGTDIRIVPNMLGRDDFEQATMIRSQAPKADTTRLRIGWGGGIGHAGDLEILHDAMIALKDEVEWVFLGMDPVVPEGVLKFHAGTANPDRYLASLAALNVDLIVAPLEENLFNRCKSNLRLIEAGACAYPVIASPVAPYLTDNPPVFAYPTDTASWIESIRDFIASSVNARKSLGKSMYEWANSRFNLDTHAELRLKGWLPKDSRPFKSKIHVKGLGLTIIRVAETDLPGTSLDLIAACEETSNDVLYLRGDVTFSDESIRRLRGSEGDVVIPFSNDPGPWGFPSQTQFTPFDSDTVSKFDKICAETFDGSCVPLAAVGGPVVLLKRSALAAIGSPDFENLSHEIAIMDFASAARSRGLNVGIAPNSFAGVTQQKNVTQADIDLAVLRIGGRWPQGSNDDTKLRAVREKLELVFHREYYTKIMPQNRGDYAAWVADCDSRGKASFDLMLGWAAENKVVMPTICHYPCTPESLGSHQKSDWLFFVPKGAQVPPDAQAFIGNMILENDAVVLYGDHDHLTPTTNTRVAPDFKPDLDVHLLLCRDYVSQAIALPFDLVMKYFEGAPEINEANLYRLVLAVIHSQGRDSVAHISRILAHLPPPTIADAVAVADSKLEAAQWFVKASGWGVTITQSPIIPVLRVINYAPAVGDPKPLVSIIIPTKDNFEMLSPCVATLDSMTDYENFEIVIMSNNTTRPEMQEFLDEFATSRPNHRVVKWDHDFNWSTVNNVAVREYAKGDFLCFLNDDTRVLSRNWLAELVGAASLTSVGAAGAKLLYPHGLVQHVGVVCHRAITAHIHKGLPVNSMGTNFFAGTSHESTAVTGACLVTRRDVFESVGGFDESYSLNFNDVVFCLELRRRGYLNVLVNTAELQHFEGVTRNPKGVSGESRAKLQLDGEHLGRDYMDPDPYWNPNLTIVALQGGMMIAGMDMATFEFPALPPPWGVPPTDRVLVIGDLDVAAPELQDGATIYGIEISANLAKLAHPPMANSGPWDIRELSIRSAIDTLDISKVLIGSLGELPLQTLSLIRRLGVPVIYRPTNAEAVCPRGTLSTIAGTCHGGYRRAACQSCLDEHGSPRGAPSHIGWLAEWLRFFTDSGNVEVDLSRLENSEFVEALEHVFYPEAESAQETESA